MCIVVFSSFIISPQPRFLPAFFSENKRIIPGCGQEIRVGSAEESGQVQYGEGPIWDLHQSEKIVPEQRTVPGCDTETLGGDV